MSRSKPLVLIILDGWGYSPKKDGNAILLARTPIYDRLLRTQPNCLIHTNGHYVGLPDGQMGNSEVGHLNIGAGRIVHMESTQIDTMIKSGDFFKNPSLVDAMDHVQKANRSVHLMGLLSDGGVHSSLQHLYALLQMCGERRMKKVFIHVFLDGRDSPPRSGLDFVRQLQAKLTELGTGKIATVSGRYYAMDRDRHWDRTAKVFDVMVQGKGETAGSHDPEERIKAAYESGVTDEFILPFSCAPTDNTDFLIKDEDSCVFFNFRSDRAREITRALTRNSGLDNSIVTSTSGLDSAIPMASAPKSLHFVCMTRYDQRFQLPVVVPNKSIPKLLAEVFDKENLRNLRLAETEKYAHVTYFFNGGAELPFPGEERLMIQSPSVPTYDLLPEMSAHAVTGAALKAISENTFDVIIINFANADMVGHSGKVAPTIKAVEVLDACLGEIERATVARGGSMLITADHGNAEMMIDPLTREPHTAHTTNPVPFILIPAPGRQVALKTSGSLADVAPTMLGILGIAQPKEMTGQNLMLEIAPK